MSKNIISPNTLAIAKSPSEARSKLKKKKKSLVLNEAVNNSYKILRIPIKIPDITVIQSRSSANKENIQRTHIKSSSKPRIIKQSTSKKKFSYAGKKNKLSNDYSLGENRKMRSFGKNIDSKSILNPQKSENSLKSDINSVKITPRSSHPSPQVYHNTPDTTQLTDKKNKSFLTSKKAKAPGLASKRFSHFDKKRFLYSDAECTESNKSMLSPTGPSENAKQYEYDHCVYNINSPDSLKLINMPLQINPRVFPNNFLHRKNEEVSDLSEAKTQKKNNQDEDFYSSPENQVNLLNNAENLNTAINFDKDLQAFASPTRIKRICGSPDSKDAPDSGKGPKKQLNAPRKTIHEFESPGSFIFSLSSSSDEDFYFDKSFMSPLGTKVSECQLRTKKRSHFIQRDEQSQTDLSDIITNTRVLKSLKLIENLSEIISLS